jgi:hypothetical protein
MKNPELSEYIAKRFQEKLDKWESKIDSNKFLEEYNSASDKQNEKVNEIVGEDMKTISNLILNSKTTITKD